MVAKRQPWFPALWADADVYAIQALARGEASPEQQKRALTWIVHHACATYEEPFVEGKPDASANIAGRRSAGLNIVKLINLDLQALKQAKPKR